MDAEQMVEAARLTCRLVLAAAGRDVELLDEEPEQVRVGRGVVTLGYGDELFAWFPNVEHVAATVVFGGSLLGRVFDAAGRPVGGYVRPASDTRLN